MDSRVRPLVVAIVTPAWADANNGNWQTARRWARLLALKHTVLLCDRWPGGRTLVVGGPRQTPAEQADVLIALHAGRSAASVQAWHHARGAGGLAVVLTGTDLYRDLNGADPVAAAAALCSLESAAALVVLQDQAPAGLPAALRSKARVIFQSTTARRTLAKADPARRGMRAIMVGHLRAEKDPQTLQAAAALLEPADRIRIDHAGAALQAAFETAARAAEAACPHYRWLGPLSHEQARRRIQRAHVLVHCSRLEGGAHVIMEAVCSGTPVLASRMAGNVGMLGQDYAGYFPVGDAAALAQALRRFSTDAEFRQTLLAQCALRAPTFDPARESAALHALVEGLAGAPDPV